MYKNYFHITELDFKNFFFHLPNKKSVILDYGCGNGIFNQKHSKNKKIKIIKMFDRDKKLKKTILSKYKSNKNIMWIDSLKQNYDVVFINSVIQYLNYTEYKKLIYFFFKKKIKLIIISDIPKYPRFIEGFFLTFINPFKLIKGLRYIFNKDYVKSGFYFKKTKQLIVQNNNYNYKIETNLNDDKLLRYSLIIQKKIK
jgi:hypothetical protein